MLYKLNAIHMYKIHVKSLIKNISIPSPHTAAVQTFLEWIKIIESMTEKTLQNLWWVIRHERWKV